MVVPFAVRENFTVRENSLINFTLSKKSERSDIFTEIKHLLHWQKKIVSRS